MLLRLDSPWTEAMQDGGRKIRVAPATVIVFRTKEEYVELHCRLIEQPDETLYIYSRTPRVVSVLGRWKQKDSKIEAVRKRVARSVPFSAPIDPLCAEARLTFKISGNSVLGNASGLGEGMYAPVTRLVAPDFESYVDQARRSPITCGEKDE
jgi:hypothetical protein